MCAALFLVVPALFAQGPHRAARDALAAQTLAVVEAVGLVVVVGNQRALDRAVREARQRLGSHPLVPHDHHPDLTHVLHRPADALAPQTAVLDAEQLGNIRATAPAAYAPRIFADAEEFLDRYERSASTRIPTAPLSDIDATYSGM